MSCWPWRLRSPLATKKRFIWHIAQWVSPNHYISTGSIIEARTVDEADLMVRQRFAAEHSVPLADAKYLNVSLEEYDPVANATTAQQASCYGP